MSFPKASDVIATLQGLILKHGDLPICVDDPDTGWRLEMGIVHKKANTGEKLLERFEVKTEYSGDPKGLIVANDHPKK